MLKIIRSAGTAALVASALTLTACGSNGDTTSAKRKHYSQVYTSSDGNVYARTYDDDTDLLIWYILFMDNQPATTRSVTLSGASSNLSSASWKPSSSVPPNLEKTTTVVETDEKGEPTTDSTEDAEAVSPDETTDADTTEADAQAQADADAAADAAAEDNSSDSSSDSGDSSGGDASGGDSGGGDAGGGDGGGGGGE